MDPFAIEELAANTLGKYLVSVRDNVAAYPTLVAAGVSLPAEMQILMPFSIAESTKPVLNFARASAEWPSQRNPNVTIDLEMQTIALGEGRVESNVDAAWFASIRRSLMNHEAFLIYLQALTDADRTGWKLLSLVLQGGGVDVDTKKSLRVRHCTLFLTFLVD